MEAKQECDEHVLHHIAIWQLQRHSAMLQGSKKSRVRMKVPSTTRLSSSTLSPLLTTGKNKAGYFLDRVVYSASQFSLYRNRGENLNQWCVSVYVRIYFALNAFSYTQILSSGSEVVHYLMFKAIKFSYITHKQCCEILSSAFKG
jgi:hypothetical protein